jgi:hypothetical protein
VAINRYRFYVGPVGGLRALPPFSPSLTPEASPIILGGNHVTLSGRVTRDRIATKRQWEIGWERLKQDDLLAIESFMLRAQTNPYFLIDGRRKNILHADASATGNASRSKSSFTASAGTLTFAAATMPTELVGVLDSHLTWTGVANTNTLRVAGTNSPPGLWMPVLPGSTYTFSAYLLGTTTCRLTAFPYNAAGVAQTAATSGNLTLTGSYQRFNWVWTPLAGEVAVNFGLTATGSGNISTVAWQVEMDQAVSNWAFGFGCPEVVLAESPSSTYPKYPYYGYSIKLLEV